MPDDQHLKTYKSLGIEFLSVGDECVATCTFCDHSKLYINAKEGFFDCKVCGNSGNKYTFMQLLYDELYDKTKDSHYKELSGVRGKLHWSAFKNAELAYDYRFKNWWIPVRNQNGSLINVRIWNPETNILRHTGGCSVSLYNMDKYDKTCKKVYICEGEWDCIAMEWFLLTEQSADNNVCVVSVPGASMFKQDWCKLFTNKEVTLLYDNDKAGRDGSSKAIKVLTSLEHPLRPSSIKKIDWPESTPDKFDIRDFVTRNQERTERGWREFQNMLVDVPLHNRKESGGLVRRDFEEVIGDFKKHIQYIPQDCINGLLLSFSVIFSNRIAGEPIWLFLIGPPGGGKTLMLQSVSDVEWSHYESSLSPKTLVSGFKMADGSDPSLLPKIIGKTLILKEYTEIMALSGADQDFLFGVLRGAYDGRVERTYPHGVTRIYPVPGTEHRTCHFSMLAGVTNAIHGDNRAALGERFLKFQMFPDDYDPVPQIESAMNTTLKAELPEFQLRESASSFIEYKMAELEAGKKIPTVPEWIQQRVIGLSQIVSMIRAMVARKQGELLYRPAPEIGTRLSKQLIKFSQCIAFTLGKEAVDEECYSLLQRVGMDSCYGWHRDIVFGIAGHHPQGVLQEQICKESRIGRSTASRALEDLYELGAIDYKSMKTGLRGNPPKIWRLSPLMERLFDMAQLNAIKKVQNELPTIPDEVRKQRLRRGRKKFVVKDS